MVASRFVKNFLFKPLFFSVLKGNNFSSVILDKIENGGLKQNVM